MSKGALLVVRLTGSLPSVNFKVMVFSPGKNPAARQISGPLSLILDKTDRNGGVAGTSFGKTLRVIGFPNVKGSVAE